MLVTADGPEMAAGAGLVGEATGFAGATVEVGGGGGGAGSGVRTGGVETSGALEAEEGLEEPMEGLERQVQMQVERRRGRSSLSDWAQLPVRA